MPQVSDAPKEVNAILEGAYSSALKKYPGNEAKASKIAWGAVKAAGWHKNEKTGKWVKSKGTEMADENFVKATDLVIFKTGTWNGENYTEQDLDNMVKSFDEPIPFIIGHSSDYKGHTRIPAFGRIVGGLKRVGRELIAMGVEFNSKLTEWIREGFYPGRSIELSHDNKRVLAVGMIGAASPAVKGLPGNDEALQEIALQFSDMKDAKVIEFTELDAIETLAVDDTFKALSETCMKFLETIEKMLVDGTDPERLSTELWEMQADMCQALNLHEQFLKKLEQIEGGKESEMNEKRPGWKQFKETIKQLFTKRKESLDMDAQKEEGYKTKITELEAKVSEFAEKERLAIEAKRQADEAAATAVANAVKETKKTEVKTFCETAITEGRMTPAEREADEPRMFTLIENPEALKSFQEGKYPKGRKVVSSETDLGGPPPAPKGKLDLAADYVKAHQTDKEFAGLNTQDAVARAVYLEATANIKF